MNGFNQLASFYTSRKILYNKDYLPEIPLIESLSRNRNKELQDTFLCFDNDFINQFASFVYTVEVVEDKRYIKIGKANNPLKRKKQLERGIHPYKYKLTRLKGFHTEKEALKFERKLFEMFSFLKKKNEWYLKRKEVVAKLDQLFDA